jgi:hypothetical protein
MVTASNQGFYNNFQYKMRLEVTPLKESIQFNKTAKRFSTWVSYTYSVDYERLLYSSTFPNNVDIRHSASLSFNYDLLKISVGEFGAMANRILLIEGNETESK